MTSSRFRLVIEIVLAGASILAFIATMLWPRWFEWLFGSDPDGGDGTLERVIALSITGTTAVVMLLLAGRNVVTARRAIGSTS